MQVYGGLISPFVRKVALVLEEKSLPWDLVLTNPGSEDPEFRAASPFGKIPGFRDGDYRLSDSSAIVAYLDARYPEVPLLPANPEQRGRAIWIDEFTDTIFAAAGLKVLFNRFVGPKFFKVPGNEAMAQEGEAELPGSLAYVESIAPESGWLLGDELTLADIAVAAMWRTLDYVSLRPTAETHPRASAWYVRVCERPSWARVAKREAQRAPKRD